MTTQVESDFFTLKFQTIFLGFLCLLASGCGSFRSSSHGFNVPPPNGINSNVLILVTDVDGNPVPGATVWIPADDAAMQIDTQDALDLVDEQGNACADPPETAIFEACTGNDGIALLPCGNHATYLVKYASGAQSGMTNAKCAQAGVVPAPLGP